MATKEAPRQYDKNTQITFKANVFKQSTRSPRNTEIRGPLAKLSYFTPKKKIPQL